MSIDPKKNFATIYVEASLEEAYIKTSVFG